jgi:flavin reductase (DIM6/NTAB) family NADH-FMN oxidoreductase RutF
VRFGGGLQTAHSTESLAKEAAVEASDFKSAMRCLTGGVVIITAGIRHRRRGLTATAVCSLSAEPPSLVVCINRSAEAHEIIRQTGRFAVSILEEKHVALADRFAGRDGSKGESRFGVGDWNDRETGAPVLADAVAWFDCKVINAVEVPTHTLFIGLVVASSASDAKNPLIYLKGAFGTLSNRS